MDFPSAEDLAAVVPDGAGGVHLVATDSIPAGSVVMASDCYASAVCDSQSNCASCLGHTSPQSRVVCPKCGVSLCGDTPACVAFHEAEESCTHRAHVMAFCQRFLEPHGMQREALYLELLALLMHRSRKEHPVALASLKGSTCRRGEQCEVVADIPGLASQANGRNGITSVWQLITNFKAIPEERIAEYEQLYRLYVQLSHAEGAPPGMVPLAAEDVACHQQLFLRLCAAVQCNAFSVFELLPPEDGEEGEDEFLRAGVGIYLKASVINHSCACNIARLPGEQSERGGGRDKPLSKWRTVKFITLRDVKKGEPLCISYVDTAADVSARQSHLLQAYGFACRCDRCVAELAGDFDGWRPRRCSSCAARGFMVPVPRIDGGSAAALRCAQCGAT